MAHWAMPMTKDTKNPSVAKNILPATVCSGYRIHIERYISAAIPRHAHRKRASKFIWSDCGLTAAVWLFPPLRNRYWMEEALLLIVLPHLISGQLLNIANHQFCRKSSSLRFSHFLRDIPVQSRGIHVLKPTTRPETRWRELSYSARDLGRMTVVPGDNGWKRWRGLQVKFICFWPVATIEINPW